MNQKIIQTNPKAPVIINAACQPHNATMAGIASGATMAPTFVPELNIPMASALSFLGNHSAIALFAAGKLPDSLIPRSPLQNPKPSTPFARACPIAAMLQKNTETPYPNFVPNLSISLPTTTIAKP